MTTLELRSISKVYGRGAAEVQALRDVSLSVAPGKWSLSWACPGPASPPC